MKKIIFIIFVIVLTACTSTKYVEVPVESTKTEYISKILYDSIYIHDSIDRYRSNDTVYYTTYRYIDKWHNRVDTVLKIDTIKIPVIQEVTTIKEINKLTYVLKFFITIGILFLVAFVISIVIKFYGKFKLI